MKKQERIQWIDFAKGLTIILVIVGHTFSKGYIRGPIFSFHMPLFFMLSLATYSFSNDWKDYRKKQRKAFNHLIPPAIFIWLVQSVFLYRGQDFLGYVLLQIKSLFWASGYYVFVDGEKIPYLGIAWFLVVLFLSRALLDGLSLSIKSKSPIFFIVLINLLGIVGVYLGYSHHFLPLSFDLVLGVLPFLGLGHYLLRIDYSNKSAARLLVCLLFWCFSFGISHILGFHYLELAIRQYSLFPLSYMTAVAGVLSMCQFCFQAEQLSAKPYFDSVFKKVKVLGRYSLILLIIHALEDKAFRMVWEWSSHSWLNLIIRLTLDLIIFTICLTFLQSKRTSRQVV
ncbi:Fucose 4-O-acetylase and related acetyltransferases [Streptococcus criceti]|uniref:Acyltransferase 3 domain-containing protein n=1 Tax=Streptococcus criceti HS-6 TaxID=873449 RepID=G5JNF7_STRCG|nr:acyltransferase family protein [Streptococcus criceti]EHI74911.1 hypothetical protein STRCR_1412 [Streptococcus criceti HS-6]SUN43346.1 Fucose 4-O-acetylase and related acetyltransferases [Streptococcus criceti]